MIDAAPPRPRMALGLVCAAIVLVPIVATGASVALSGISDDLGAGLPAAQWVVNSFFLTFASLMALTGALADQIGRRRVFSLGLGLFCIAMAVAGLAPDIVILIAARAVAGAGAAAVTTGGSAVLAQMFSGVARTRAFAAFGTAIGVGLAFGPLVAGAVVTSLGGWRVFFVAAAVLLAPVLWLSFRIADSRDKHPAGIDWGGAVTFTSALSLFVVAIIQGPSSGWGHPLVVSSLVASACLGVAFVAVERRHRHPMIEIDLLKQPAFVAICVMPILLAFGFVAMLVALPPYFIAVDGLSAQAAGLLLVLLTGPTLFLPLLVGSVASRVSRRLLLLVVVALLVVGAGWLTVVQPHVSVARLAGPLLTLGCAFGVSLAILDGAAVASVEDARAGMAAGMFNTMRLGGESIAIAVFGSIVAAVTVSHLTPGLGVQRAHAVASAALQGAPEPGLDDTTRQLSAAAYTAGLHAGLWFIAGLSALGFVLVVVLMRTPRTRQARSEPKHADDLATSQ